MNQIEEYLARAAGLDKVKTGDEITLRVDLVIAHDVTGPMAVEQFEKIGVNRVFDREKVVFVLDHMIPAATVEARASHNALKEFSRRYGVKLYDQGDGVIHQLIAEKHRLARGSVLIGADSHTCTAGAYGVLAIGVGATELAAAMATGTIDLEVPETCEIHLEGRLQPGVYAKDLILHVIGHFGAAGFTDKAVVFTGSTLDALTVDDKMTISNMTIEMGAMIGYFTGPGQSAGPVKERYPFYAAEIPPSVACPPSPAAVVPAVKVAGTKITQAVIGSCTNGRFQDMVLAAEVMRGRKVADGVTLLVIPASKDIAQRMDDRGLTKIFRAAGGIVASPGCGPCFGAHMGLLAGDDVAVSTTNRNFPGRMGHRDGKVYLASPRLAAESAVAGEIVVPGTIAPLGGVRFGME